ncbi:hypothetical protein HBB16_13755 [Pseudonocardia sp. MCCB 268]|nr:hypothetical protein [Pseudonocardia cytotoxica]
MFCQLKAHQWFTGWSRGRAPRPARPRPPGEIFPAGPGGGLARPGPRSAGRPASRGRHHARVDQFAGRRSEVTGSSAPPPPGPSPAAGSTRRWHRARAVDPVISRSKVQSATSPARRLAEP